MTITTLDAKGRSRRPQQPAVPGIGNLFISPIRKRDRKKTRTLVAHLGLDEKIEAAKQRISKLEAPRLPSPELPEVSATSEDQTAAWEDFAPDAMQVDNHDNVPDMPNPHPSSPDRKVTRRLLPDSTTKELYHRWKELVIRLVDPLISYMAATKGKKLAPLEGSIVRSHCKQEGLCVVRRGAIFCLFLDCKSLLLSIIHPECMLII